MYAHSYPVPNIKPRAHYANTLAFLHVWACADFPGMVLIPHQHIHHYFRHYICIHVDLFICTTPSVFGEGFALPGAFPGFPGISGVSWGFQGFSPEIPGFKLSAKFAQPRGRAGNSKKIRLSRGKKPQNPTLYGCQRSQYPPNLFHM